MKRDEQHYLSEQIDPLLVAGARDFLYPHLRAGRVLNLGLGYGVWDERLAGDERLSVTGVDLSEKLVAHFSQRFPKLRYVCSDVFDFRPEQPFATIVASHFLEHIADAVGLLRLIRGWIQSDGVLLLVVPNASSVHRQIGVRMGLIQSVTDLNDGDRMIGHQRVYTAELLRAHFAQSGGFQVELLRGVTLKTLSNAQLATLPRAYVEACCTMDAGIDALACQLALVARPV
jgi:2-polyprenyl-3-methyl-5-hydroxy-6-metoxy-1,4-benzoquinol methylase